MKAKIVECCDCGRQMYEASELEVAEFEGLVSEPYEAPLYRCDCGTEVCTGAQMRVCESEMNKLKARYAAGERAAGEMAEG